MSAQESLSHKVLSGSFWQFSAKFSQALINLLVQIALARLLVPEDFALLAICAIVLEISELLVDGGFASALIQKDSLDKKDLDTVFYVNVALASLLFCVIALSAPYIAHFFNFVTLAPVLIAVSIGIPLSSLGNVQNALLQKNFKFKSRMKVSLSAVVLSGICSVSLAALSFGVWALVCGQLLNRLIYTAAISFIAGYKPGTNFSFERSRSLWNFGFAVLISNLLSIVQRQAPTLLIAKAFTPVQLGYVSMAQKIDKTASVSLEGSLMQALFPAFSSIQKDQARFSHAFTKALVLGNFIFIPLIFVLIIVAPDLVLLLFGQKWILVGPYLQALSFFTLSLLSYNTYKQACLALSLSKQALIADLMVLIISIIAMLIALPYGIIWVFIIQFPVRIIGIVYQHIQINKHIALSVSNILKPLAHIMLASAVMIIVMLLLSQMHMLPMLLKLMLQLTLGALSYLLCAKLFMSSELKSLLNLF